MKKILLLSFLLNLSTAYTTDTGTDLPDLRESKKSQGKKKHFGKGNNKNLNDQQLKKELKKRLKKKLQKQQQQEKPEKES